jgi:hypothetical protein
VWMKKLLSRPPPEVRPMGLGPQGLGAWRLVTLVMSPELAMVWANFAAAWHVWIGVSMTFEAWGLDYDKWEADFPDTRMLRKGHKPIARKKSPLTPRAERRKGFVALQQSEGFKHIGDWLWVFHEAQQRDPSFWGSAWPWVQMRATNPWGVRGCWCWTSIVSDRGRVCRKTCGFRISRFAWDQIRKRSQECFT